MRILAHTNAPYAPTGYGGQIRQLIPRMQALGHTVGVVANFGLSGATLNWNGVTIYGLREMQQNADVIGAYVKDFNADIVISLYDVWALPPDYRQRIGVPWAAMVPVDGAPVNKATCERLKSAEYVVSYSQFGDRELRKTGFAPHYCPHGIDVNVFKLGDKAAARKALGFPEDRWIIVTVAANKGYPARKGWPEMAMAYAKFHERHPESLWYCHTTKRPYGSGGEGIFFDKLIDAVGLPPGAMAFPDQGSLGVGVPDPEIARIYQAADVMLLASLGEGFGLPVLEAQLCGCPVIVQKAHSTAELCRYGLTIEPLQPMWLPQLNYWWSLPSVQRVYDALEAWHQAPDEMRERGPEIAQQIADEYNYDAVFERYWVPFLESVEATLW
jgi:glycosyltransferase involved in cell wall biosynthesis